MPTSLRTRIDMIEPAQVLLTTAGRARIRVRGFVIGVLSCAGQQRALWGSFDESFLVSCEKPSLSVSAFGVGGRARQLLRVRQAADLAPPQAPGLRRLRFAPLFVPSVAPLTQQLLMAIAGNNGLDPSTLGPGEAEALPAARASTKEST